ncbi:MAG: hypothetical protein JW827_09975 [Spirochaetes bacterium]|nr:hypothetical protein [Spirochaetota bacterium]
MEEYLKIKCPHCESILIIDRHDNKVVEVRKPLVKKSSGDRFQDAFEKYKSDKNETKKKFQENVESMKNKKAKMDEFLKKRMAEIDQEEKK